MIHSKGLTVEMGGERRLGVPGRFQVDGNKVRVRISLVIKVD